MERNNCNDNYNPPPKPSPCDKECPKQEQGNLAQCQEQGDLTATQGDQYQTQGDQSETQGNLSAAQGDQSQTQGDQSATQGDQTENLGDLTETQGDLSQTQGDLTENQGELTETQGDQSQTQGELTENQGNLMETQGDQIQTQGDLSEMQGNQSQNQGDQTETLGDMAQYQGGETQGDLVQGDQAQSQGDQTQGDQTQTMTGHGGQTLGDQILTSSPSISTPVNVSGVNVNVTVSCCDELKKYRKDYCHDCQLECRNTIKSLLLLIKTLSLPINDLTNSQITLYYCGLQAAPTLGNLSDITDCTFAFEPAEGGNKRTFLIDVLETLSFEPSATEPNIFTTLLAYLQSLPSIVPVSNANDKDISCNECCFKKLLLPLQAYLIAMVRIQIELSTTSFTGYIYKINNDIIYLVDDLTNTTVIDAIPICKIISYYLINATQ